MTATSRAALAFGLACAVTLFGLLALPWVVDLEDYSESTELLLGWSPIVLAAVGAGLLGGQIWRSFPIGLAWPWMLAAVPLAAFTLGVSVGFVALLGGSGEGYGDPSIAEWVSLIVLAPLLEEWLCRGVAWNAAETMSSPRKALVLTAVLFAFLHGLQGHMLALPHRFVGGLVLGLLRYKSGSLLPGILCHALHNAAAVYWFGG